MSALKQKLRRLKRRIVPPSTPISGESYLFMTLDSLRYDVFERAEAPFLKSLGVWKRACSPASYTFPAHMSFFMGKLPQSLDETPLYDSVATRVDDAGKARRGQNLWRVTTPEAVRAAEDCVTGSNLIEGFGRAGYRTIGSGAMNWFNVHLAAGQYLTRSFDRFGFFGTKTHGLRTGAAKQVGWIIDEVAKTDRPYFAFANLGETHHYFEYDGCPWQGEGDPYGDREKCLDRQTACLEHLDGHVRRLVETIRPHRIVICGDHGEALGEDGLWGHGFSHPSVMEVPMLINLDLVAMGSSSSA
ncbi:MAG: sulfatase-like hydrolase/transferase [Planctomycetota bacterium]